MKGEFLSEIIEIKDIVQGKLNLINAPCGCGKTTFAKTKLKSLNPNTLGYEMLYLIDTANGKEQLLRSAGAECRENYWTGKEEWFLPGITIMTYAGYATLHIMAPEHDIWSDDSGALIVCDELQSAIEWSKWGKDENGRNVHEVAINLIKERIKQEDTLVVALSATPSKIKKEFEYCLNEIELHGEPRHYENEHTHYYSNLRLLLEKEVDIGWTGIIYVPHITQIQKYQEMLEEKGLTTAAIWSPNNKDHPMTTEQLEVRSHIIEYQSLPSSIDALFINKSCETSISIGTKNSSSLNYMIIHSTDQETQIQARGRYRKDLPHLYLLNNEAIDEIFLPKVWLNRPLNAEDKKRLCHELEFKDKKNGRVLGWTSVKPLLVANGYRVTDGRTNSSRYSIISE